MSVSSSKFTVDKLSTRKNNSKATSVLSCLSGHDSQPMEVHQALVVLSQAATQPSLLLATASLQQGMVLLLAILQLQLQVSMELVSQVMVLLPLEVMEDHILGLMEHQE